MSVPRLWQRCFGRSLDSCFSAPLACLCHAQALRMPQQQWSYLGVLVLGSTAVAGSACLCSTLSDHPVEAGAPPFADLQTFRRLAAALCLAIWRKGLLALVSSEADHGQIRPDRRSASLARCRAFFGARCLPAQAFRRAAFSSASRQLRFDVLHDITRAAKQRILNVTRFSMLLFFTLDEEEQKSIRSGLGPELQEMLFRAEAARVPKPEALRSSKPGSPRTAACTAAAKPSAAISLRTAGGCLRRFLRCGIPDVPAPTLQWVQAVKAELFFFGSFWKACGGS